MSLQIHLSLQRPLWSRSRCHCYYLQPMVISAGVRSRNSCSLPDRTLIAGGNNALQKLRVPFWCWCWRGQKVESGPGSICTLIVVVGVLVTAYLRCAAVAREYGKTIIADGGISAPGDIVKALAGGNAVILVTCLLNGQKRRWDWNLPRT